MNAHPCPDLALPRRLSDLCGRHDGETIVVCGCGSSLNTLPEPGRWLTVGVNDVGRLFHPTYLVVLNPRKQFRGDRFRHVEESRALAVLSQLDLGIDHPCVIRFRLGRRAGTDLSKADTLPYTRNSPYVAVCLAAVMGARRIGLIGVDFTDHHFFGATGRHPLQRELRQIDREYGCLERALSGRGIELVNLSPKSQLTTLRKTEPQDFLGVSTPGVNGARAITPVPPIAVVKESVQSAVPVQRPSRLFLVHYQFLSCGDVITRGLEHAARDLGIEFQTAGCNDNQLPTKVERFQPDLLLVIHGRQFRKRWRDRFKTYRSAVWLLDEPYEVDDTERTSQIFDTVFVNDTSTLNRHRNAHYLPTAYDPELHHDEPGNRPFCVGFVGGGNPTRERMLLELVGAGQLDYVVGGPWRAPRLRRLNRAANISPAETSALYRQTRIIVNVFRDRHHYNRQKLAPHSLNPRIYEALACGALVVSEHRPELDELFPELPTFRTTGELKDIVGALASDADQRLRLLEACRGRLAPHTYTERLRAVLNASLDNPTTCPSPRGGSTMRHGSATETPIDKLPAIRPLGDAGSSSYDILMVVHNSLEMIRLATLQTLRHTRDHNARLIVVDNASSDGSERWLKMLADRGDIDLVGNGANLGHGPGLEAARAATSSPYIVTLDSDAFPLSDDWLTELRRRLDDGAHVAGIGHHRGYIHPSCLMVARHVLDDLGLTFLNEKDRQSRLDVAERISVEVQRRGGKINALERSAAARRGSISEPVYLGSEYAGIVHHQWYTTRSVVAEGGQVDDVPQSAISESLRELVDRHDHEARELTVVVGVRAEDDEHERRRNARATLEALNRQSLERWRYRVVVVEQDSRPRLEDELGPMADRYIFAYNPGPYNRSWAFNVGASSPGGRHGVLCLMDADLLVPPDFLSRAVKEIGIELLAALPYREVLYLDPTSTERAIAAADRPAVAATDGRRHRGRRFRNSEGGCVWVEASFYHEIGGHDENYRGWGREDREFWQRVGQSATVRRLPGRLLHLHHPRPPENDLFAQANQKHYDRRRRGPASAIALDIGKLDRYANETDGDEYQIPGRRDWEHWHLWTRSRIDRIAAQEARLAPEASPRHRLALILSRLGKSVLDVGCGPGAIGMRLGSLSPDTDYFGVDATLAMVRAAHRSLQTAGLCQADGGRLPFADDSFDAVLVRHVLEHLPVELMATTLQECARVASNALVLAFYVPPSPDGARQTRSVGGGFLETAWPATEISTPIETSGWQVVQRVSRGCTAREADEIWIAIPGGRGSDSTIQRAVSSLHESFKISIVLPTFQRPHTLPRTIDMVLAQTYQNWELIIVDNAGDGGYEYDDPRIRVHHHNEQASASYARNQGLSHATGDLICFFDDDDEMFPRYLELFAAAFLQHPRAKMVRCGMVVSNGRINYSFATPECCLRRDYATPTWDNTGPAQDQRYFRRIARRNRWSATRGDIVVVREALCRATTDPEGGLRAGTY